MESIPCQSPCSSLVVAIPYTFWCVVVHSCWMGTGCWGVRVLIQEICCDQEGNDVDSSQKVYPALNGCPRSYWIEVSEGGAVWHWRLMLRHRLSGKNGVSDVWWTMKTSWFGWLSQLIKYGTWLSPLKNRSCRFQIGHSVEFGPGYPFWESLGMAKLPNFFLKKMRIESISQKQNRKKKNSHEI